jgi:hypothetical protein
MVPILYNSQELGLTWPSPSSHVSEIEGPSDVTTLDLLLPA